MLLYPTFSLSFSRGCLLKDPQGPLAKQWVSHSPTLLSAFHRRGTANVWKHGFVERASAPLPVKLQLLESHNGHLLMNSILLSPSLQKWIEQVNTDAIVYYLREFLVLQDCRVPQVPQEILVRGWVIACHILHLFLRNSLKHSPACSVHYSMLEHC